MEKQTRGPIGTHSESTQRCPLLESLLCKHALGTDSAVPLGSEKVERHLIIFHESGYIIVLQNGFISNLIKTWTYAIRTHKKGSPPNNFFFHAYLFSHFSAYEKAVWAMRVPAVVYGTSYSAKEQFGIAVFLLMRKM